MIHQILKHPPPDWNQIVLTGHFDHDDVLPIANRLHDWLVTQKIVATPPEIISDDEEMSCRLTVEHGHINESAVRVFLESLHAHPKILFQRGTL